MSRALTGNFFPIEDILLTIAWNTSKWQIPTELKNLLDDAIYWHANDSFPPEEMTIRIKHRLVSIHCFPNGNGRHSRLLADMVIEKIYKLPVFTWGRRAWSSKQIRG